MDGFFVRLANLTADAVDLSQWTLASSPSGLMFHCFCLVPFSFFTHVFAQIWSIPAPLLYFPSDQVFRRTQV
jgi:hypothetical protein